MERGASTRSKAMDKVTGVLEVGTNGAGEVVVNHPDLITDANGCGHIVFSPAQARHLAKLLLRKADDADVELVRVNVSRVTRGKPTPPDTRLGRRRGSARGC